MRREDRQGLIVRTPRAHARRPALPAAARLRARRPGSALHRRDARQYRPRRRAAAAAAREPGEQGRPAQPRVRDAAADDSAQDRRLSGRPQREPLCRLPFAHAHRGNARDPDSGDPLHGSRRHAARRHLAAPLFLHAMPRPPGRSEAAGGQRLPGFRGALASGRQGRRRGAEEEVSAA